MTSSLVKLSLHFLLINVSLSPRIEARSFPSPSSIIDGPFAGENEFKYIAAIKLRDYDFLGAGSIIHPEWIITARHVIVNMYEDEFYFNFSALPTILVYPKYLNNLKQYYTKVGYPVKHLYCHPIPDDVNVFPYDNDIALIQLQYPIPLDADSDYYFEKIDLNTKKINFDFDRIKLISAGWGLIKRKEGQPLEQNYYLRTAQYRSQRSATFVDYRPYQQFEMHNPRHEICDGDSGGPVVIRDGSGKDLLVGIVSYGTEFCDGPSVQQNVEFYKEWIKEVIEDGDSEENLRRYSCENFYGKEYQNSLRE